METPPGSWQTRPPVKIALEDALLRPWRSEDAEALARNANEREITRSLRDAFPHPYSLEHARAWLASVCPVRPVRFFAIEIEGEAAGGIGVSRLDDIYRHTGEIAYWLAKRHWNRGIVSQAVDAITRYAFTELDLARLQAGVLAWNVGSIRVLEKCGYVREGLQRRGAYKEGQFADLVLFARLRPDG